MQKLISKKNLAKLMSFVMFFTVWTGVPVEAANENISLHTAESLPATTKYSYDSLNNVLGIQEFDSYEITTNGGNYDRSIRVAANITSNITSGPGTIISGGSIITSGSGIITSSSALQLTINNVNLQPQTNSISAIDIGANNNVILEVLGDNTLITRNHAAGIRVPFGSTLTIIGNGKLTIESRGSGSGVGGNGAASGVSENVGNILISENVTVKIKTSDGAGIGSGAGLAGATGTGNIGNIGIVGNASVTVQSDYAAGIGGARPGSGNPGSIINITNTAKVTTNGIGYYDASNLAVGATVQLEDTAVLTTTNDLWPVLNVIDLATSDQKYAIDFYVMDKNGLAVDAAELSFSSSVNSAIRSTTNAEGKARVYLKLNASEQVTVTKSGKSVTQIFNINAGVNPVVTVLFADPAPVSTLTLKTGLALQNVSAYAIYDELFPVVSGGTLPLTFEVLPTTLLPNGVTATFVGEQLRVYGIPSEAGNFNVDFKVTDALSTAVTGSLPFSVIALTIPTMPSSIEVLKGGDVVLTLTNTNYVNCLRTSGKIQIGSQIVNGSELGSRPESSNWVVIPAHYFPASGNMNFTIIVPGYSDYTITANIVETLTFKANPFLAVKNAVTWENYSETIALIEGGVGPFQITELPGNQIPTGIVATPSTDGTVSFAGTFKEAGFFNLIYRITDLSNNTSVDATALGFNVQSAIAPTPSFSNGFIGRDLVIFLGKDYVSRITSVRYNGALITTTNSDSSITIPASAITAAGTFNVQINADGYNTNNFMVTIVDPALVPTMTASVQSTDGWFTRNINIELTFNGGNSALVSSLYAITNSPSAASITAADWKVAPNLTENITIDTEGSSYIHFKGINASGLSNEDCLGPYKLDKTLPAASNVLYSNISLTGFDVEIVAADLVSGMCSYATTFDRTVAPAWSTNSKFTAAISNYKPGDYVQAWYKLKDNAGNETEWIAMPILRLPGETVISYPPNYAAGMDWGSVKGTGRMVSRDTDVKKNKNVIKSDGSLMTIDLKNAVPSDNLIVMRNENNLSVYNFEFNLGDLTAVQNKYPGGNILLSVDGFDYYLPFDFFSNVEGIDKFLKDYALYKEDITLKATIQKLKGSNKLAAEQTLTSKYPDSEAVSDYFDISLELRFKNDILDINVNKFVKPVNFVISTSKRASSVFNIDARKGLVAFVPSTCSQEVAEVSTRHHSTYVAVANKITFDDTTNHWAAKHIDRAANKGLVVGTGKNNFDPDSNITRAQFIQMVVAGFQLSEAKEGTVSYSDVKSDKWYYDSVLRAKSYGLLDAFGNKFEPEKTITREEMAYILDNLLSDDAKRVGINDSTKQFDDISSVSGEYSEAVLNITTLNIMQGMKSGSFDPQGEATRAQATTVILNALISNGMIDAF